MRFVLEESRRLTGPNLWMNGPGAIIEVDIYDYDIQSFIDTWSDFARKLLYEVGWIDEKIYPKAFSDGANLVFTAPIDALYAATEINDYAYELTIASIENGQANIDPIKVHKLKEEISNEINPKLIALREAAIKHKVAFLSDDDEVSIGLGKGSKTWPIDEIPNPNDVNWSEIFDVPVALVTGTNGKSTTVRLTSEILKSAGLKAGITSTDFIKVGSTIIDRGDYSGPGGARTILRHPDVDIAILEVARGGILRRGLPVEKAKTACVTNIAADHLGQYGIHSVEELAEAKFVVTKVVDGPDFIVLNADDQYVIDQAMRLMKNMFWTSLNEDHDLLQHNGCFLKDNVLWYRSKGEDTELIHVNDMGFTVNGAAVHNVYNAMSAVGICKSLGITDEHIKDGLQSFKSDSEDNPGRTNFFTINGATVIVDFAHNEHGMNAIISMGQTIEAKRKLIMVGHAGDRTDHDIEVLCESAFRIKPDCVVIAEVPEYLRGRDPGELPRLFQKEFLKFGMDRKNIIKGKNSIDAVDKAIEWMQEGDLLLLMVLNNKEDILKKLSELESK